MQVPVAVAAEGWASDPEPRMAAGAALTTPRFGARRTALWASWAGRLARRGAAAPRVRAAANSGFFIGLLSAGSWTWGRGRFGARSHRAPGCSGAGAARAAGARARP